MPDPNKRFEFLCAIWMADADYSKSVVRRPVWPGGAQRGLDVAVCSHRCRPLKPNANDLGRPTVAGSFIELSQTCVNRAVTITSTCDNAIAAHCQITLAMHIVPHVNGEYKVR